MGLEHTKTAENLQKALAGESIARNKYTFFAQVARDNGNEDVAVALEPMAKNEMMHAKFWFAEIFGKPTDTKECLMQSAQGEYKEWHDMYPEFARQAREDGLEELATMFEKVAAIERSHEKRFMTLLAKLSTTTEMAAATPEPMEKKEGYRCQFCGALFERRPDVCDTCGAIGSFEYAEYYV